ncbi:zinc metalloprotease [Amylibacter marinus]|uniref:Zinc metalloprotease n=1 Tax=Amylibacter marinus TaxID=1475483 RepID=A0ABQ5VSR7_9RHOB|nr:RIP metalloprotease RseP [Amylibacter marinus]GLQ34221.1 zinc metalloprotease [Amylibacter marinus]
MFELIDSIPLVGGTLALILPFVIVLSVVVFIHEFGHYIVGRWCGIHAEVFSLGMGPVLFSRTDQRGTRWQLAAIPIGGYVKFLGDANEASTHSDQSGDNLSDEERARHFFSAALYKRALTVLAGPVANFLLSIYVFAGLLLYTGEPNPDAVVGEISPAVSGQYDLQSGDQISRIDGVEISAFEDLNAFLGIKEPADTLRYTITRGTDQLVVDGPFPFMAIVGNVSPVSPASKAGLKADDLILSYGGVAVKSFGQFRDMVFGSEPTDKEITVLRGGEKVQLTIQPHAREIPDGNGGFQTQVSIGVTAGAPFDREYNMPSPIAALGLGIKRTWFVITQSVNNLALIIRGEVSPKNLQGPVGIAHVSGDIAKSGWVDLITLIAFISTAIGFLNLLPIPVLDGGHLMMYAYEFLAGKPPSDKFIRVGTTLALSLLLTLMLFVTFNDLIRLALYWA